MSLEGVSEIDLLRSSDSILKRKPWRLAARPNQIAPPGDWGTWAIISGRGFGKTRSGTEWIHERAHDPMAVLGISSPTTDDIKKVLVFGPAGIMATSEPGFRPEYHSADREGANYLVWPNGVHGFLYSAEEPDRCRGPAHSDFYGDEIAAYPKLEEMLYNIRMGLRIKTKGNNEIPRLMLTSTPRPLPEIRALFADPNCIVVTGSTWDNEANLPAAFIADMHRRFDNTRIGAQELEGKVLEEAGALFTQATLDKTRVAVLPQMLAWGVGVDPSAGDKEGNDEQGIGDGGLGADDHLYITGDATVKLPPAGWGHATVKTAIAHTPWATVWVEKNTGGQMAAHVVNIAAEKAGVQGLKVEEVVAKTGKHVRAEMLSALFEQGRAHILGKLDDSGMVVQDEWSKELEKELLGFTAIGYAGKKSPNRADGCVWMANGLMGRGSWAAGEVDESLEEFV